MAHFTWNTLGAGECLRHRTERAQSAGFGPATALAAALVVFAPSPLAHAEQPTREEVQQKLEAQKKALEGTESRARKAQSEVQTLAADREALTRQLKETAKNVQRLEGQLTQIEGRIAELETKETAARQDLAARHDQIARLLGALQRMGRNPPPVMITERADALAMVRAAMVLASAQPHLSAEATDLAKRIDDLVKLIAERRAEGERWRADTQRMEDARIKLVAQMEEKRQSEAEYRQMFEEARRQSLEIAQSVDDLGALIDRLGRAVTPGQPATGVRTLAIEVPATAPAPPKPPAAPPVVTQLPPPPPLQRPEPPTANQQIVLAPAATSAPVMPRRFQLPPFETLKAKLAMPAAGRRVIAYGERNKFGRKSEGMVIETRFGARITAPADGWVAYASPFRSLGQLLIINVGDGYHIVMANLSQIDVQPGHFVSASEPVGTMGLASKSGANETLPTLYIEFRKDSRTVDPEPWWVVSEQKVQG